MLRRLVTPRWLGAVALAVLFAIGCYHLGWWQYHRHEAKSQRNERLDAHYLTAPVPLGSVLTPAGLNPDDEWTRVSVSGTYGSGPVLVRNRTLDGDAGYEALWALDPSGGGPSVVVDRGWVARSDAGAAVLPVVRPAPTGEVSVIGWLRPGERARGTVGAGGELASLNLVAAAGELSRTVLPAYVLLDTEVLPDGSTPPRPTPLGSPDRSLGPHLAYACQWWLTMAVGFFLIWFGIRRELRAENPERYPPKVKKTRIWDEEDG
ncbi:MAG: SURF1 family protein [Ornithinibacter sp.]